MKIFFVVFFFEFFFALVLPVLVFAEGFKKQDYLMDGKYRAGEYLIYDCELMHYACVDKDSYEDCRDERTKAVEKKRPQYPCAPLNKFESKKACVQENYRVQDLGAKKRFCYPH